MAVAGERVVTFFPTCAAKAVTHASAYTNRQVPDGQAGLRLAWLPIIGAALSGRLLGRAKACSLIRISAMPVISLFKKGAFDPETTSLLASAFETAWETVKKSGSPLAVDGQALSTREILAKCIIELAQAGERDPVKLTSDALAYLSGSRSAVAGFSANEEPAILLALAEQRNAAAGRTLDTPGLRSMLSTAELARRPSRPPDHEAENKALIALAQAMAASPEGILQKLADTALTLCRAHSAGLSLLEEGDQKSNFHWRAIAGQWAPHLNGGTPRNFGPCGTVLDQDVAMVCSHPELDFPYWAPIKPVLEEGLLIPFHIKGEAVGTIWVVAHDASRRFDAEDLRVMTSLGTFAAAAYQTLLSLNATQRIASIVESSADAIVSKDLNGVITSWNYGAEQIFGYTAEEAIGKPITILNPPDRHDEEPAILERIRRGERVAHYETVRMRKDGSRIDISLTVSPVQNTEGKIIGASKIARDITERKNAEAQITVLAREAEHRARNVLASVQAAVHLSNSDTPEGLKHTIEGRIQALANVHRLFVESRWAGAELHSLVKEELAAYCRDGEGHARIDGPRLLMRPDIAQAVAVALHELATNAAKYGALSVAQGYVRVEWSRGSDGRLVLRWTETGGPPGKPPRRQGFGTRVMDSMIRGQLKGDMRFDWRAEGLACEIVLPV
jgi:PAS domain S-box-containing protein